MNLKGGTINCINKSNSSLKIWKVVIIPFPKRYSFEKKIALWELTDDK